MCVCVCVCVYVQKRVCLCDPIICITPHSSDCTWWGRWKPLSFHILFFSGQFWLVCLIAFWPHWVFVSASRLIYLSLAGLVALRPVDLSSPSKLQTCVPCMLEGRFSTTGPPEKSLQGPFSIFVVQSWATLPLKESNLSLNSLEGTRHPWFASWAFLT